MTWTRWIPLALPGLGFALVELLAAPATRPAIGVGPLELALGVLGLCGLHLLAGGLSVRLGPRAVVVPVVLWATVWGPEQARARGLPVAGGWAAPVVLALVGSRAPSVAAAASLLGALPVALPRSADAPRARCTTCPDIVLVTVDTARWDAGLVEAAGASGWEVGAAIAPAPWTPPSMQSLFLGAPVPVHGAGVEASGGVRGRPADAAGLVEALRARGYATAAFVSNPHLREEAGFARGFDVWAHAEAAPAPLLLLRTGRLGLARWLGWRPRVPATDGALVTAARAWLTETAEGGRFLWVHLMGPHAWPREHADGRQPVSEAAEAGRARYAAHVERVGATLVPLWDDVPAGATIVLTSDHGELLGEGGVWGHGRSLAPELLRVPLAIRGPGLALPPGTARLTGLRAGLMAASGGDRAVLQDAEGAVLAGVRGDARVGGIWRNGGVTPARLSAPSLPEVAPLAAGDRAALEALGYLGTGEDR